MILLAVITQLATLWFAANAGNHMAMAVRVPGASPSSDFHAAVNLILAFACAAGAMYALWIGASSVRS